MAQISLHDYLQQIDTLLEENRLSEAVAHCRHILKKFPRHVDTYRLYGKALLEQQKFDDAVDIFQRVLSADPEDFISHVGLAITHKEKGEVPEAIWHFERAFEMDPYNSAIQDELGALYAHRDGQRPERINLTRGALARLYFRGHLYRQAAAELRSLLSQKSEAQNGERLDLQTLLAETLWRDDQRVDVVDVCLRILEKTPFCIKANAILAEVWLVTGRSDEAHEYLQRLRMLTRPEKAYIDPDSVVGRAFTANGVVDLPDKVFVDELDYIPVAQELQGSDDWVSELSIESEEIDEEANWLDEIEKVDAGVFAEAAATDADEDMLDWLREVSESGETAEDVDKDATTILGDMDEPQPEAASEISQDEPFDWFSEDAETSRESLSDVPDWLSEVTASAEADMWNLAIETSEESQAESDEDNQQTMVGRAQTPDWIRDVSQENESLDPTLAWQEEDEEPSWLSEDEPAGVNEGDVEEFPAWDGLEELGEDLPDWLTGSGEASIDEEALPADWSSSEVGAVSAIIEGEEALPDWLTGEGEALEEGFPELFLEESVFGVTGEEIPDWLLGTEEQEEDENDSDLGSFLGAAAAASVVGGQISAGSEPEIEETTESPEDTTFDLESDTDFTASFSEDIEDPFAAVFEAEDDELPDWLVEAQAEADSIDPAELEELPDWLRAESGPLNLGSEFEDDNVGGISEETGDETADWLSQLEQTQQSDEELPDWLEDSPELVVGQTDIDLDALPDWLDGGDQEDSVREETLMGSSEEQENKEPDIPEDLDEAMKWLEELAAEQGADLAELPSLQQKESDEQTSIVADDDVPDWLKDDLSDGELSGDDDLPDWLKQEAESMAGDDWMNLSGEDDLAELDLTTFDQDDSEPKGAVQSDDDIPDWLKARMPSDFHQPESEPAVVEEDLSWLDQIAAGEGAPLEELPTLSWDEDQDDIGLDFDDSEPSWIDDVPEVDIVSMEETPDLVESVGGETADDMMTSVPDDPDEAMAWLESLAAQQGAPLDELPTIINDEEPEPEAVSLADILDLSGDVDEDEPTVFDMPEEADLETVSELDVPEDPDEAMAWLEQLAAQQGASLDELPTFADSDFDMEATVITEMDSSETPTVVDFPTDDVSEAELTEAGLDIPDDPDEAMAWLEQLAARQGADLEELPTVNVVPEMVTPVTGLVMEEEVEMISEPDVDSELEEALADLSDIEMPEDDDEALAWLAALTGETAEAQEESAAFDEMPLFEEPELVETYEAFESEASDEVELFELPSLEFEEAAEDDSILASIGEGTDLFLETPEELPEVADSEFDDEELDSALPDWLKFGPTGETSREELDWLENFGDSDVDSWLEAEEQITQYDMPAISDISEPEPVASEPELLFDTGPLDESKAPVIEEFEVESLPSGPVDEDELESARSALEIGDFESALERYNALLQSGQGLPMLIADLETASTRHTKIAPLQRLLGDAYMQNGQLQKAIDTYRRALDNL